MEHLGIGQMNPGSVFAFYNVTSFLPQIDKISVSGYKTNCFQHNMPENFSATNLYGEREIQL